MLFILRSIAELLIQFKPIRKYTVKRTLEDTLRIAAVQHLRHKDSDRPLANEIEEKGRKVAEVATMFEYGIYDREPTEALVDIHDEFIYFESLDQECRN